MKLIEDEDLEEILEWIPESDRGDAAEYIENRTKTLTDKEIQFIVDGMVLCNQYYPTCKGEGLKMQRKIITKLKGE